MMSASLPKEMPRLSFDLATILCVVFAIALQVQVTLFASPTYLGLRINVSDLLVPFAGMAILISLLRRRSFWPDWILSKLYFWLSGLTIVLTLALVHTYFGYGEISRWALVNKYAGWFILLCLLGLGGWIGTNASEKKLELFLKIFLYFGLATLALNILALIVQTYYKEEFFIRERLFPLSGLMVNRNAYAFLFLTVFSLATCQYFSGSNRLHRYYMPVIFFLIPFFLIFNASRAMTITLGLLILCIILLNIRTHARKLGLLLLSFAIGVGFLAALYHDRKDELFALQGRQLNFLGHLNELANEEETPFGSYDPSRISYPGDSMRMTILTDAKEMVEMHPITGSGLGSMLLYQQQKHGKMINLIDCTPLWLLVEAGLIGLLAFAAFYLQCFKTLYSQWREDENFMRAFRLGILTSMVCFTLMGLFHELMYTRFVWVLLGIGLTMRPKTHQA